MIVPRFLPFGFALVLLAGWFLPRPVTLPGAPVLLVSAVLAEESWLHELEETCSRTGDAMNMSEGELQALIDSCDRLKPKLEVLDESARKVYRKRLLMCRQLYQFVLESKRDHKEQ